MKVIQTGQGKAKVFLLTGGIILHIKDLKDFTRIFLQLINTFRENSRIQN